MLHVILFGPVHMSLQSHNATIPAKENISPSLALCQVWDLQCSLYVFNILSFPLGDTHPTHRARSTAILPLSLNSGDLNSQTDVLAVVFPSFNDGEWWAHIVLNRDVQTGHVLFHFFIHLLFFLIFSVFLCICLQCALLSIIYNSNIIYNKNPYNLYTKLKICISWWKVQRKY